MMDCSSDVCSSGLLDVDLDGHYSFDLALDLQRRGIRVVFATAHADDGSLFRGQVASIPRIGKPTTARALLPALLDRKTVVQGKSAPVRVDLGGRSRFKKQNHSQTNPHKHKP